MQRKNDPSKAEQDAVRSSLPGGRDNERHARRWRRQDLAIFLIILAVAFSLRQIYVLQLSRSPAFEHPEVDELYHDQWAGAIVNGERFVDGPYFRAPLYPFFLAAVYKVFGVGYFAPRIAQGLIGSLTCGLLFLIGRQVFSRAVGAVAGLVAATYWVLIYFDGELLIPSVITFLDLLLIWLLLDGARRPGRLKFFAGGVVLGLSAIARPNILLFAPAAAVWLIIHYRSDKRRAWGFTLLFALGCLIPVLPVTLRNYVIGRDLVLIASQGGVNFYIGNNPKSNGMVAIVPDTPSDWWGGYYASVARAEEACGRKLQASEVSRYYYGRAWAFILSEPGKALGLMLRKLHLFWRHWEISNNKDIYFWTERFTPLVKYLPLGFGIIGPLGILGMILCRRRASELFPLWGFILVYMGSVVLFFCTGRFRVPILAPLILLAVYASFEVINAIRRADGLRTGGAIAILLPAALFVWIGPGADSMRNDENSFQALAVAYEKDGRFDMAVAAYRNAMEYDCQPKDPNIPTRIGYLFARLGEPGHAQVAFREALAISPHHPEANDNLGSILSQAGRFQEAAAHFETAIQADPTYANAYYGKGLNLMRQQRSEEAVEAFETCLQWDPDHIAAHTNLGSLLAMNGRLVDAAAHFQQALRIDATSPLIHNNLANVLRDAGRLEEAVEYYRSALRLNPNYAKAHQNVGEVLLRLGQADYALPHLRAAVRLLPDDPTTALKLAWLLATHPSVEVRNGDEAIRLAEAACRRIGRDDPAALDVLAAACAEAGDFPSARAIAQRALEALSASSPPELAQAITARLRLYEKGYPYRQGQ